MTLVAIVERVYIVAELERPRMRRCDVVGLVEGIDRGFPVTVDLDRHIEAGSGADGKATLACFVFELGERLGDGFGIGLVFVVSCVRPVLVWV